MKRSSIKDSSQCMAKAPGVDTRCHQVVQQPMGFTSQFRMLNKTRQMDQEAYHLICSEAVHLLI